MCGAQSAVIARIECSKGYIIYLLFYLFVCRWKEGGGHVSTYFLFAISKRSVSMYATSLAIFILFSPLFTISHTVYDRCSCYDDDLQTFHAHFHAFPLVLDEFNRVTYS